MVQELAALHIDLTRAINDIMNEPQHIPTWLTSGIPFLLPKSKDTRDPRNYRPITCLPATYKIITAGLANRIYNHLLENGILLDVQKACRKASRGCKDQLLVSKMIVSIAKKRLKNLCMAWIDYKKAFYSIPHTCILEVINIYRVYSNILRFIETAMKKNGKLT